MKTRPVSLSTALSFSCSDQVGAACANESVYLDHVTSSLDRTHYPSLLTNGRYHGDDYTRMKWSPDAQCRLHFNHILQPSSMLAADSQQYPGTTNVAGESPEMPCCEGRPTLFADVTDDVTDTALVADQYQDATYPAVCLYDNRPPTPSSSCHV